MNRLRSTEIVLMAALAAASCATTMTVGSHVERGLDFSTYRTFEWAPADGLPIGDPRLERDPFFNDHVQGAIESQLAARGLALSTSGTPDLLIHYHASIRERIDVNRLDRRYGYCALNDCPVDTVTYEAGTLVVDVIETRSNRLVWRGWAQNAVGDMLDDPKTMRRIILQAVTRMLERFPRTRSSARGTAGHERRTP
jgi:hypothetical protein